MRDTLFWGADPSLLADRARRAAAAGSVPAARFLAALEASNPGRCTRPTMTGPALAAWRCPVCGGGARVASGRSGTVTCSAGHVRNADRADRRDPVLRALLGLR